MTTNNCPQCGRAANGKFCSSCGTVLGGSACTACGVAVKTGVRFCHICGAPVGASPGVVPMPSPASRTPWLIAGSAIVILILIVVGRSRLSQGVPANPVGLTGSAPAGAAAPGGVPDIANMSPRERANRLFNRVLAADERGDTAEVEMFSPMAIQSYDMLGVLDTDARYDKGMILAVTANYEGALALADTIEQSFPNHLLAKVIRATVAERTGDGNALANEYREFLAAFDDEIARERGEYQAHRTTVDGFREEARNAQ